MDNFGTIEVRWFYRGALPTEVEDWFATKEERLEPLDTRSDVYLQSHAPDLGVKFRQGKLELKYRQALHSVTIADDIVQIEQWTKWICTDRVGMTPTEPKLGWIEVAKIRDRRCYRIDRDGNMTQIAIPTADAAAIELTQLQVNGQHWWTIGCEYFGTQIAIESQFLSLVTALRSGYPSAIGASICCGYPQWLSEQGKG